jgi:hypothetical protein
VCLIAEMSAKEGAQCPPAVLSGIVIKVSTSALNRDGRSKKFLAALEDGRLCYYPTKQVNTYFFKNLFAT